jgi:hypothetical protein
LAFASDELVSYSLERAIQLTREGKVDGAHVVQRGERAYIRTNPKVPKSSEFDTLSITARNLLLYAQGVHLTKVSPALYVFVELYRDNLDKTKQLVNPVGQSEVLAEGVRKSLQKHGSIIFDAARKFEIDPYLLGAILVDEIARLKPFETITDELGVNIVGLNISVGIGQVKIDTANDLIKKGVYHPDSEDKKLPFVRLTNANRAYLYVYLIQPKHSIYFAAAFIRYVINFWKPKIDLAKRPEIIATLYSLGYGEPKPDPVASDRGEQIIGEFYPLAKSWLDTK